MSRCLDPLGGAAECGGGMAECGAAAVVAAVPKRGAPNPPNPVEVAAVVAAVPNPKLCVNL